MAVTLGVCRELSSLSALFPVLRRSLAVFPKVSLHWPQAAKYQLCPVFLGKVFKWQLSWWSNLSDPPDR
jgi:hypothetical protein